MSYVVTRPPRPIGVVILAILQIISGIGDIIVGVLLLLASVVLSALIGAGIFGSIFFLLGLLSFGLGIFSFIMAYGIWTGRGWAWVMSIVGAVIGLTLGVLGLIFGGLTLESMANLLPIILSGLILVYLNASNVRAFFGRPVRIPTPSLIQTAPDTPPNQAYVPPQYGPSMYPQASYQQPYFPQPRQSPFQQPTPWSILSCPNCGTHTPPGSNYCDRCGARLT